MSIIAAITATIEATKAFFGWKTQKEINKPTDQKREETQQIRKTRDEEIQYNADVIRYGTNSDGSVRRPDKDK